MPVVLTISREKPQRIKRAIIYQCLKSLDNMRINEIRSWTDEGNEIVESICPRSGKCIKIFSGICPHFGGPLTYDSNRKIFICTWHYWIFDNDGYCTNRNVSARVTLL